MLDHFITALLLVFAITLACSAQLRIKSKLMILMRL